MSPEANQPVPSFAEFPTGTWRWDFSDDSMLWDEPMCRLFGIDPGTFGGASDDLLNLVHPGDRTHVANSMVNSVESGTHFEGEFRVQWPDGTVRSVVMRGEAIRDEHGKAHGMAGTCEMSNHENISGLTASMERTMFAALMDNLPDCIYFKDMNSRMIVASQANARWFGLESPNQLIGKTDFDLFTDEHALQAMEDEREILETGRPIINLEEKETWPDGHCTYVSTSKMPLRDERGRIIGTFGLSRDITERKHAEEQLAQFAEELRHRNEILEEELAMARELQLAMLPQSFPSFFHDGREAIRFFHFFQPSTTVSGDFFDVYQISSARVGIFICDVMGHGVGASLIAATARALVEELTAKGEGPGTVLTDLNTSLRRILRHNSSPMFVTACYLEANLATGELQFANAGHPRPFHVKPEGTTPLAGVTGPVLGLFDEAVYQTGVTQICSGDKVLLFTDGLYEVESPEGDVYDYSRLQDTVEYRHQLPLKDLCRAVVDEVKSFSTQREFSDDVCLIGLELA
jgi:phosphoserine phosphatase RsbU/P